MSHPMMISTIAAAQHYAATPALQVSHTLSLVHLSPRGTR